MEVYKEGSISSVCPRLSLILCGQYLVGSSGGRVDRYITHREGVGHVRSPRIFHFMLTLWNCCFSHITLHHV